MKLQILATMVLASVMSFNTVSAQTKGGDQKQDKQEVSVKEHKKGKKHHKKEMKEEGKEKKVEDKKEDKKEEKKEEKKL